MLNAYDLIVRLTSQDLSLFDRTRMLTEFAYGFGWQPSDSLDDPTALEISNAHLVVEHGLENTAVITFLRSPRRFSDLNHAEQRSLLNISYNNLVDWHIHVEIDQVNFVFNRTDPPKLVESSRISRDHFDELRSEAFEKVAGRRPNPNLPPLDDALIKTISFWKRKLSAELGNAVKNEDLSALFNSIIFVRALEDNFRRSDSHERIHPPNGLLKTWEESQGSSLTLREIIPRTIRKFYNSNIPDYLINERMLNAFDIIDRETVFAFLSDFYHNKYAPYEYDFSLMSKHALSRIYEHYVSILRFEESAQLTLFPSLPEEERDKAYGSIYTPQFIARFFAKYLREQIPPVTFKRMRTADPACGSGIFLRTLLEIQCDPTQNGVTTQLIQTAFGNMLGLDTDDNACQATRLSLALLHLVLTGSFPQSLDIISAESIGYFQSHKELKGAYDAVIANPPFVSLITQSVPMRKVVSQFMGEHASGKIDMSLAFLRIGLEMLRPGGYGLFVLPHSFLLGKNARGMRKLIAETSWIRCLADLSAIRVFEDSRSYIVLLIFQKKPATGEKAPLATIIKCQDSVGRALQDAIDGRYSETSFYSIYDVSQDNFRENEWILTPPTESTIKRKFKSLPTFDDFLICRVGFISGADNIFILSKEKIPKGEDLVFAPFLHDREMKSYTVPDKTSRYFFYPYIGGKRIKEESLKNDFPRTWEYLNSHRKGLKARSSVIKNKIAWWEPERPREPKNMMRPKIVSPHLVLVPRFSLDRDGRYAISRSPLLYPKEYAAEDDLLRFFVAVLNSTACFWYMATHSHPYQRGYTMLEPKTLKGTPTPDPTQVVPETMRRLLRLVDKRIVASESVALDIEREIDVLVADLYELSSKERRILGMEE